MRTLFGDLGVWHEPLVSLWLARKGGGMGTRSQKLESSSTDDSVTASGSSSSGGSASPPAAAASATADAASAACADRCAASSGEAGGGWCGRAGGCGATVLPVCVATPGSRARPPWRAGKRPAACTFLKAPPAVSSDPNAAQPSTCTH